MLFSFAFFSGDKHRLILFNNFSSLIYDKKPRSKKRIVRYMLKRKIQIAGLNHKTKKNKTPE